MNFPVRTTERAMKESDRRINVFLLRWLSGENGTTSLAFEADIVLIPALRNLSLASGQQ